MRKQLEEIRLLDQYILHKLSAEDKLLLDAKMILSPLLRKNCQQQFQLHQLVLQHGREQLRNKINQLHSRLMRNVDFSNEIHSFFK